MPSTPEADAVSGGSPELPLRRRFRVTLIASGLLDAAQADAAESAARTVLGEAACDASAWDKTVADVLVSRELLTRFQAEQLLLGRSKLTLGQYRILDQVGQGGMGRVFKARHAMMRRIVAVKVLTKDKATPATEAAFLREIERLGDLDHDNLLRALDAGRDGKVYYLVTEYIEGLDLRRQVLKHGALDEVTAASVITQAARGLAYAHEKGIIHRDVKPGNLLATPDGRVKVLDLGLAGSVFDTKSSMAGRVIGTMDYMAPEQIRAPDSARPPADIYGLGCTLYFLLVGKVPFPGGTREEKAKRQLGDTPVPIQQLAPRASGALCAVVDAMMRKNPAERIATAQEVIERLRPWTPETPVAMPRTRSVAAAALPHQSSSRDSTRGLLSLSEETAGGSGGSGTSDQFGVAVPRSVPRPVPQWSPGEAARSGADGGPGDRLVRFVRRGGASLVALLPRDAVAVFRPAALRMLSVAAVVGFLFGWAASALDSFLNLFANGFPLLVGGLVFAVMLGVQVWAAVSARHGED
jgi:serine/threonine protein kinase